MKPKLAHFINGPRHGDTSRVMDSLPIIEVPIPNPPSALPKEYREDAWGEPITPTMLTYQIGLYRLYGSVPPSDETANITDYELVYGYIGVKK